MRSLETKQAEPIDLWYKEVVKGFEMLVEQNTAVKASLEEVKDDQKKQNLGKLDEQSKTLALEEEVGRLQFEVEDERQEKQATAQTLRDSEARHEEDKDKIRADVADARGDLEKYKAKLDKMEKMNTELQANVSKTGSDLVAAKTAAAGDAKGMEDKNVELAALVKKLQRELALQGEKGESLGKRKDEQEREGRKVKREMEEKEKAFAAAKGDLQKKLDAAQQKAMDANKSSQQLKTQKDQMKKLWESSKKKGENLKEEVDQLKKELDEVLKGK